MIKKMKHISILAIFFLSISLLYAQNLTTSGLNRSELKDFNNAAYYQIERLQNYLDILGATDKNNRVKEVYHRQTLLLFADGGKDKNVQVSLGQDGPIASYQIDQYLRRLRNLSGAKIEIIKVETLRVSNIRRVGNQYEAVASIFQHIRELDENGQISYKEQFIESKKIVIRENIENIDSLEKKWGVVLGNIEVIETRQ